VNNELQSYHDAFHSLKHEAVTLLDGITDAQWEWHPDSGRWSVAQCLEHLCIVGDLLIPKLEEAIQRGRENGLFAPGPFSYSWPGRMFVDSLQPGARMKMRTVKLYQPTGLITKSVCVGRFTAVEDRLASSVRSAEGLDLVRIKVSSPANRLLRFSLGIWFAATIAHQRRHIDQALRVTKDPRCAAA
jgi:hypothetical protein